ncbi:MAG: hypothetical protein ABIJ09_13180 [Pseudomonadota bacterium]
MSPLIPEILQVLGTVGCCAGCGLCAPAGYSSAMMASHVIDAVVLSPHPIGCP